MQSSHEKDIQSRTIVNRKRKILPIILAAGDSPHLEIPKPLALFGEKTALQIALDNCADLRKPVVVLGSEASRIQQALPAQTLRKCKIVINRRWRTGQLSSLLAGLQHVPRENPFLLYPVDYPLLTKELLDRLAKEYEKRYEKHLIVSPTFRRREGHPVIFAPEMRAEIFAAETAREVVRRDRKRVKLVAARTSAIWASFNSPSSYRKLLCEYLRQSNLEQL